MAMVSAHRCGAGSRPELENTRAALEAALRLDVDYVEFDVRRCRDGAFVVLHDAEVAVGGRMRAVASIGVAELGAVTGRFLRYEEVLEALAVADKKAHLDLKLTSPAERYSAPEDAFEVEAIKLAIAALGAGNIVVTTLEDDSVRAIRQWADGAGIDLLVGLSLGRSRAGLTPWAALRQMLSEVFPGRRLKQCGANVVVAQRYLARLRLARWARRRNLPLLVWTVDSERELRHWLKPGRAWIVTTNVPARALAIMARH